MMVQSSGSMEYVPGMGVLFFFHSDSMYVGSYLYTQAESTTEDVFIDIILSLHIPQMC